MSSKHCYCAFPKKKPKPAPRMRSISASDNIIHDLHRSVRFLGTRYPGSTRVLACGVRRLAEHGFPAGRRKRHARTRALPGKIRAFSAAFQVCSRSESRLNQGLKSTVGHPLVVEGRLAFFAHAFEALVSHHLGINFITAGP
jgi:hypothetical protein